MVLQQISAWLVGKPCTSANLPLDCDCISALVDKAKRNKKNNPCNSSLTNTRFVVFDTETTGFDLRQDDIISIAGVVVENGQIKLDQAFDRLVNPMRTLSPVTSSLTGITQDMIDEAQTIYPVLLDFLDFVEGSVLVAHSANFDVAFLEKYLKRAKVKVSNPVVDTMVLSRVLQPNRSSHSLDDLIFHYDVPMYLRHTALGDSLMTAHLFIKMINNLQSRRMVTSLSEFQQLLWVEHL